MTLADAVTADRVATGAMLLAGTVAVDDDGQVHFAPISTVGSVGRGVWASSTGRGRQQFREHYRDDLEQAITDLSAELGRRRALSRVVLDLVVTVPRYRIEVLMKEDHTATVLTVAITAMACIGIVSIFTGLYFGGVLLVLAVVLAVTQRSSLARSIDPVNGTGLRRKRLMTAAVLGVLVPVIYLVSLPILGDDWGTDAQVAFGVWLLVLIGAVVYLIAGLTTPKSHTA